jgi:hypothetical protein
MIMAGQKIICKCYIEVGNGNEGAKVGVNCEEMLQNILNGGKNARLYGKEAYEWNSNIRL